MGIQVHLTLRAAPDFPVEAAALTPDNVDGKDRDAILALPLLVGNQKKCVSDYFEAAITDDGPEEGPTLVLSGDLSRFRHLGEGMTHGRLVVEGPAGFHAGAWMSGGGLTVRGDAGDCLGAHMAGGLIEVTGNAGHFTGSAYRGYDQGMTGGTILIRGDAGQMTGARMCRGLIAVQGGCGDLAGYFMHAGTVLIGGLVKVRAGANMSRGTIMLFSKPEEFMPTFRFNCVYRPSFWPILRACLAGRGFDLPDAGPDAAFASYSGDVNEAGKGEILLWSSAR